MRVLFWGTPEFALPALRALDDEGHEVVGVVTQPDRPSGRGRRATDSPVKAFAVAEHISLLQPERADDESFLRRIRELEPEISVVVAFGQILPQAALDLPTRGSINIHGSLLPELRGAAPVHWAILRGFHVTGVTIMQMDAGLDSGSILYQVEEPIRADETMSELAMRLSEIGAEALIETLTMLEVDGLEPVPQDDARATYAPKVNRKMARIDWSRPALDISRHIRGLDASPGAWTLLNHSEPVKLFAPRVELRAGTPGEVLEADQEIGVLIGTASDEAIRIREAQPSGRRRMGADEWVRGRGVSVGDRFG